MSDHAIERAHSVIRAFVRSRETMAREEPSTILEILELALPPHFAYEERVGGFLDRLRNSGTPAGVIGRLLADHQDLLALLTRARRALDAGRSPDAELDELSHRLAEHERRESASAARIGVPVPMEPGEEEPPSALPSPLDRQIDDLASAIVAQTASSPDFLTAVTLAVPPSAPVEECVAAFERALSARGLDFVDVCACPEPGGPRVKSARFEPGWSL